MEFSGLETFSRYDLQPVDLIAGPRVKRMLRPKVVCERTTLSLSHLYRLMDQGRFPRFGLIGSRACGLREHVLDAFLAERMAARAELAPLGCRPPLPQWHFDLAKVPAFCGIRLLRRCQVEAITGLPNSTFYPLIPQGLFPVQVSLGERAARWVAHEIEGWVLSGSALAFQSTRPGSIQANSAPSP